MKRVLGCLLVAVLCLAAAPLAARAVAPDPGAEAVLNAELAADLAAAAPADAFLVFVHADSTKGAATAAAVAGLEVLHRFESVPVVYAGGPAAAVASVATAPGVTYVEPDRPLTFSLATAHTATRSDDAAGTAFNGAGPFDGAGTSIAVVDTGIDGTHPMFQLADGSGSSVVRNLKLACVPRVAYFYNLLGLGEFPPEHCTGAGVSDTAADSVWLDMTGTTNDTDTASAGGHGTHVAAIAAGQPVTAMGEHLRGAAPGARLVGLSVGTALSVYGASVGLDWIARHHAAPCGPGVDPAACPPITVVNNSYGVSGGGEFDPRGVHVRLQRKLVAQNVVVVYSAGNSGGDGHTNKVNPYPQDPTPGVIGVANYNDMALGSREGLLHPSSSRGDRDRPQTFPDLSAPGTDITAACRATLLICSPHDENSDYGTISGTSMASPYVAGVVATLQQAKPGITPAEVEDALEDSAYKFEAGAPYVPDLPEANADGTTSFDKGHGLVDVVNALNDVLGLSATSDTTTLADCGPGGIAADPAGDIQGHDDPALDLRRVTVAAGAGGEDVSFTISVADLPASPNGAGIWYRGFTWVGADLHSFEMVWRAGLKPLYYIDGGRAGVAGHMDPGADTVTITAPRTAFDPDLYQSTRFSAATVVAYNLAVVLGVGADTTAEACAVTVELAGEPPAPEPEAVIEVSAESPTATFAGEPRTDSEFVFGCEGLSGATCEEHALRVHDTGKVTVTITSDLGEVNDYDLYVYDAAGEEVAKHAIEGGNEQVTFTALAGDYVIRIEAWLVVEGGYTGEVELVATPVQAITPVVSGGGGPDAGGGTASGNGQGGGAATERGRPD